jgi:hypothetical protein
MLDLCPQFQPAEPVDFDAVAHAYSINGQPLPSVTRVLDPAMKWGPISDDVLQRASERGSAVHMACEIIDLAHQGIGEPLDWTTVDEEIAGYVRAWEKFTVLNSPTWDEIEQPRAHRLLGFAGTPDRVGVINGEPLVLDIKSGAKLAWHGLQTAGYKCLCVGPHPTVTLGRMSVYLLPSGDYRISRHTDPSDLPTFLSLLNLYQWRNKHGL